MDPIYKVGNTINGLRFPLHPISSQRQSIALSLLISLLLLLLQWPVVVDQPNLGISVVATLQLIITAFLSLFLICDLFQDRKRLQKFRFLFFFLCGFFTALGCSYILVDALTFFRNPIQGKAPTIWGALLLTLVANISIVQILSYAQVIPFKVKTLQIPFFSIILFTAANLAGLFLIKTVNGWQLDLWLGAIEACSIGLWGLVVFMDAYWKIVEIGKYINK